MLCDQVGGPSQNRVLSDDRGDYVEHAAPERFALRCKSVSLIVGRAQLLVTELLFEHSVLLDDIFYDAGLVSVDPDCQRAE